MGLNLSIKGVPEALAERLRWRAERNHRSLQGELMFIIERAANELDCVTASQPAAHLAPHAAPRHALVSERRGHKTIEQIAAEHRALYPQPFHAVPRAVDIVRKDRDGR